MQHNVAMSISYNDVRRYAPRVALFCVFATFVMNASLNNAQVIFVTVPCALVFLWFAILFLEQKRQTATLQFQVISACLFTLLGFALGTDYVCLHFVREMSHSVYIADIVLLLISFCCFIIPE